MNFIQTEINGVYIVELEPIFDERGFFARNFCGHEFEKAGLESTFVQTSLSYNKEKNTLRGMHFQKYPYGEVKLVNCLQGKIFDVVLDLRKDSRTYLQWQSFELSAYSLKFLYIPKGVAHGFQTLADDTVIHYSMSQSHSPIYSSGVRWNDSSFKINWPAAPSRIISPKDMGYEDFTHHMAQNY